jgi:hypothetical protein
MSTLCTCDFHALKIYLSVNLYHLRAGAFKSFSTGKGQLDFIEELVPSTKQHSKLNFDQIY